VRGGATVHFLRAMGAVVWKDLAAEWRSRELISSMLVFALLVIFIFNFALELDARVRTAVTAGVLWVTFAFAGTLGLNRSMAVEKDRGCLDGLLLAPVAEGYVAVGTLLATMAVQARTRDILLPILLFPIAIPLLIAAVRASSGFLAGVPFSDIQPSLNLLIVFDVVFTAVAFMVFEFVVEE
jgi:heme exporter protein B